MWIADTALVIDRHVIAAISIIGTVCDVMGGLYLAYDLQGESAGGWESGCKQRTPRRDYVGISCPT